MSSFQPVSADLFFSRQDTNDPRLGELVQAYSGSLSIQKDHTYVLGYPDDEGIHLNGGRPGAKEGPDRIRQFLYRMTPPFGSPPPSLWEVGNLPSSSSLEQRHAAAQKQAELILSQGGRVLSFGGGHDYGYPDGAAFLEIALAAEKRRPLVINFDAHLDVRSTEKGFSSGTPFYRLMEKYGEAFDLIEIGAQFHCNSTHHIHWCQDHGVRILFWEDIMYSGESAAVVVGRFLEEELLRPRPVYLSVDIDGFSSAIAMGCSQSWATGWSSLDFFPVLHMLLSRWDVRSMGIYEVSPPLDEDNRTSKLAAQIAHRFIFHHRTPS